MIYLQMFWEFFKTGLFAVGGGLATLPFLYRMAESTGWFTAEDVGTMIAVSESTPGAIGVNMSTYVGYMTGGIVGAVITTIGLVAPSIIVIIIISKILEQFKNSQVVKDAFYGLRPASTGLIAAAGISVILSNLFYADQFAAGNILGSLNWKGIVLAIILWLGTNVVKKTKKWHPIVFIGISAVIGIIFQMG